MRLHGSVKRLATSVVAGGMRNFLSVHAVGFISRFQCIMFPDCFSEEACVQADLFLSLDLPSVDFRQNALTSVY